LEEYWVSIAWPTNLIDKCHAAGSSSLTGLVTPEEEGVEAPAGPGGMNLLPGIQSTCLTVMSADWK
jgi:hypothetical protein